ncbi:phosphoadenylyl-sulfate reductase [Paludibacterium paludis]|uniref:Adenosine 5'-phosphosulfate reductase n=1 Tax=Paludibacterium paludis TaxID=1225769 RepID=A0A918UB57_9NEIS|nr:phosphoadenylyl-sulfate reductase [Paludibacterium paludis]GGY21403.1 phosphoadenosine phosphosulfate reductase [Paludibacterium paludis]
MTPEERFAGTRERLASIAGRVSPLALACSFGAEDMVLLDMVADLGLPIEVFSLDTGRLPAETYELMQTVRERYPAVTVRYYYPDAAALGAWVTEHGVNAFYLSIDHRKSCCAIRKLEPLERALAGKAGWITGLRREQSPTRQGVPEEETDAGHGLLKFNPLADWSEAEVWTYVKTRDVPFNALHERHYPSIGCAPCTRAIAVGEDIRAGRWWWENPETRECGLHPARAVRNGRK